MTLGELDQASEPVIVPQLLECCGSTKWVKQMVLARPFKTLDRLEVAAAQTWWSLRTEDWLEAFSNHPKIGEKGKVSQWSSQEQSGMDTAAVETAQRLADLNHTYFEKFGWIFIVCANGKSADEMLSLLEARLPNQPASEIRIAAAEQNKITLLRLHKLLA